MTLGNGTFFKPHFVISGIPEASSYETNEDTPIVITLEGGKTTKDAYGFVITKLPQYGDLYQYHEFTEPLSHNLTKRGVYHPKKETNIISGF